MVGAIVLTAKLGLTIQVIAPTKDDLVRRLIERKAIDTKLSKKPAPELFDEVISLASGWSGRTGKHCPLVLTPDVVLMLAFDSTPDGFDSSEEVAAMVAKWGNEKK